MAWCATGRSKSRICGEDHEDTWDVGHDDVAALAEIDEADGKREDAIDKQEHKVNAE